MGAVWHNGETATGYITIVRGVAHADDAEAREHAEVDAIATYENKVRRKIGHIGSAALFELHRTFTMEHQLDTQDGLQGLIDRLGPETPASTGALMRRLLAEWGEVRAAGYFLHVRPEQQGQVEVMDFHYLLYRANMDGSITFSIWTASCRRNHNMDKLRKVVDVAEMALPAIGAYAMKTFMPQYAETAVGVALGVGGRSGLNYILHGGGGDDPLITVVQDVLTVFGRRYPEEAPQGGDPQNAQQGGGRPLLPLEIDR